MTLQTPEMARPVLGEGSDRPAADQARALACLLLLALPLAACETPGQMNPRALLRDMSGAAADARLPPPGLDRPTPNLASVPPIPERPDPAAREALTRRLEAERDASGTEVPVDRRQDPLTEAGTPGQPPIPARPPGPPALARAPAIPWAPAPRPNQATPAAAGQTARPPDLLGPERITPGEVPALPTPDLLAPAAPAPRSPSVEQLVPSEVPALPSPDLLAPAPPR